MYGGFVSNLVNQFKNGYLWLILIVGNGNLPHRQVHGSDIESNVTLKDKRVGSFSQYVTVTQLQCNCPRLSL